MEPVKKPSKVVELEKLRRELLRRIMASEARRRGPTPATAK
jgi:hypothetical protein